MFVGGLGASWYLMQQQLTEAAEENLAEENAPLATKVPAELLENTEGGEGELPLPVRSNQMTTEEVFRYGVNIRSQLEGLQQRQDALAREEARIKLMHNDIRGIRQEVDGLQSRVNEALTMAERLLAQLQAEWAELENQMQPPAEETTAQTTTPDEQYGPGELESSKKLAQLIQGMPPEKAAEYLKQLSNEGRIATAAKVLDNIQSRDAAKIIGAMDDPALWVQLTESLSKLRLPDDDAQQR